MRDMVFRYAEYLQICSQAAVESLVFVQEVWGLHHKIINMLQAGTNGLVCGQILYSYLYYEI